MAIEQPTFAFDGGPPGLATCKQCGKPFRRSRLHRKFCGKKCFHRFYNQQTLRKLQAARAAAGPRSCPRGAPVPPHRRRFCDGRAKERIKQSTRESYRRTIQLPGVAEARRAALGVYKKKNRDHVLALKRSEKYRAVERRRFQRIKAECMRAYGGERCVYCGSKQTLCLHHVDGDGKAHRQYLREHVHGGDNWYVALKKLGFPRTPRLIVLCKSCHLGHRPDAAKPGFVPSDFLLCIG